MSKDHKNQQNKDGNKKKEPEIVIINTPADTKEFSEEPKDYETYVFDINE